MGAGRGGCNQYGRWGGTFCMTGCRALLYRESTVNESLVISIIGLFTARCYIQCCHLAGTARSVLPAVRCRLIIEGSEG